MVVLVGATRKRVSNGAEVLADFSNRPCKSLEKFFIAAPGSDIESAVVDKENHVEKKEKNGTSMSAPLFLGAMMKLAAKFGLVLQDAKQILFDTAIKGQNARRSDGIVVHATNTGSGIIDFGAAWNFCKSKWQHIDYYNAQDEKIEVIKPQTVYRFINPGTDQLETHLSFLSKIYAPRWLEGKYGVAVLQDFNPFQYAIDNFTLPQLRALFAQEQNCRHRTNMIAEHYLGIKKIMAPAIKLPAVPLQPKQRNLPIAQPKRLLDILKLPAAPLQPKKPNLPPLRPKQPILNPVQPKQPNLLPFHPKKPNLPVLSKRIPDAKTIMNEVLRFVGNLVPYQYSALQISYLFNEEEPEKFIEEVRDMTAIFSPEQLQKMEEYFSKILK